MPWIDKELCDGCPDEENPICIAECPADAITMVDDRAEIDMEVCIRCGTCHKVCPQNAARHDSEKVPEEIEENIEWVKGLMENYDTYKEIRGFLKRIKRHFSKEIRVNEKTLERVDKLLDNYS